MKTRIVMIFASLLLMACGTTTAPTLVDVTNVETTYDQRIFEHGDKAYVIFSAWNNLPAGFSVDSHITVENDKGDKYSGIFVNNQKKIFMLPPGDYRVIEYSLYGARNNRAASSEGLEKITDITFTVLPNECVYLGQLTARFGGEVSKSRNIFTGNTRTSNSLGLYVEDLSDKFSENEKQLYLSQSGESCTVRVIKVGDK